MKAVILAAGEGNRLNPITSSIPKPMIPIAGKPLLEHNIIGLRDAGIDKILLIVGYKEDIIKEYFGDGKDKFDIEIQYITQKEYLGTANAASYAREFVADDIFLMMYGDIIVDPLIFKNIINEFHKKKPTGLISLLEIDNPYDYGIISLNEEGYVEKITEKPSKEENLGKLANIGIYIFEPLLFKAIDLTKLSIRNEYEFTDSMTILITELKGTILGYISKNLYWNDIGLPWQLLDANKYILGKLEEKKKGNIESNVFINGIAYIEEGTIIKSGTYIEGPCYIGKNNKIGPNAYLRPYTFIQDNCHIGISEIKNSIILSNTNIPHFNYIGDSIICNNVNFGAGAKVANLRLDNKNISVGIKNEIIDSKERKLGAIIGSNVKIGINASIMCGKKIGVNSIIGANTLVNEDILFNTLYYHDPYKGIQNRKIK